MFRLTDHLDMTIAVDWMLNHKPNSLNMCFGYSIVSLRLLLFTAYVLVEKKEE